MFFDIILQKTLKTLRKSMKITFHEAHYFRLFPIISDYFRLFPIEPDYLSQEICWPSPPQPAAALSRFSADFVEWTLLG